MGKNDVDALEHAVRTIGESLRDARTHASLTVGELATKLGTFPHRVQTVEEGTAGLVDEDYVRRVLDACGLPEDWIGLPR